MTLVLFIHILAGTTALASGYVALYAAKGATVHRKAGIVFVASMLAMCAGGGAIALVRGVAPAINLPAALLTASLVVTALTTVRAPSVASRRIDLAAMVVLFAVGVASIGIGFESVAGGRRASLAPPMFMFGIVGLLAAAGDLRLLRTGRPTGAKRIARHLWRMSFALFIAALSFFVGQAEVIPEPLRIGPLLALPVLAVPATMAYWLWRIRTRRLPVVHQPPAEPAYIKRRILR